jgi:imidazolonepropionase-like amidohydrolase
MKVNKRTIPPVLAIAIAASLSLLSGSVCASATLLQGGTVYTVADGVKPNTDVLIEDGKIKAIGNALSAEGAAIIDARGKRIYPGLVHANTVAGLTEVSAIRAMNDFAEVGAINPNARAQTVINPDSELLPVIRAQGVTTLHVAPQGGQSVLSGTTAIVQPDGWTVEQMRLVSDAGVFLQWPSARVPSFLPPAMAAEAKKAAAENVVALQTAIDAARAYGRQVKAQLDHAPDLRFDALLPVLRGERKVFVAADDLTPIREALAFCSKEKLRCVLVGAQDAWRVPTEIKAAGVELILGSPFNLPLRRSEGFDQAYSNAAKLAAAGLQFAISGDGSSFSAPLDGNLALNAAQYLSFGLSEAQALRAITLTAAEILGVADRVGSISVGKQADLVIVDGDLFEPASRIDAVYLRGAALDLTSRHTRLRDKYQRKLGQ